jgi:hypothetical protein
MKKCVVVCAVVLAVTVIDVAPAAAQDAGKTGLMMTTDSSVGLTLRAGDSVAVRPSISFGRSTSDFGGLADGERTTTSWTPGVSVVFYVKSWDATRLYLSPQWMYSRSKSSDEGGANEVTSTGHSLAAMLGAQHNLGARFAVFGEVGVGRSSSEGTNLLGAINNSGHGWATRSTIGAILFF